MKEQQGKAGALEAGKRDKTKPQEEYCRECLHYQIGFCNVTLLDDEEECGDRLVITCPCGENNWEIAPELYDEGYTTVCVPCGSPMGRG